MLELGKAVQLKAKVWWLRDSRLDPTVFYRVEFRTVGWQRW
jgi:hypothetical protein